MVIVQAFRFAPVLLVACSLVASAAGNCFPHGTTRTYFGGPGTGPYGANAASARPQNPWTGKFFGLRCCKSPEDCQMAYLKQISIAEARYQAMLNRAACHGCCKGNLASGPCNCAPGPNAGCGMGCEADFGSGGCGKGCGKGLFHGKCGGGFRGGHGGGYGAGGAYAGGGYGGGAPPVPPMNREDAVRYLEGFQYYPPHQLIRSPRDFFMFDVKYGIGQ